MRYELAIFDFDGTLADSFPFFMQVFNELAVRHRFRSVETHEVDALRGLSPREIMQRVGLPATRLPGVTAEFIAMMRAQRGVIAPFPGARQLLVRLHNQGVQVAVVSSNAYDNVAAVLGATSIAAIQHVSCGMSIFGKRSHLRKVVRSSGTHRSRAIYVGDQATDLEAAHNEGIAFGAVGWGYGLLESLKARGAEHAFGTIDEIAELFEGKDQT